MNERDVIQFAEEVLEIELLPWQADALRIVAHGEYRSPTIHPRRAGRRRGIEQMQAVLDEWKQQLAWSDPEVELVDVYRVAAKYLPRSVTPGLDRIAFMKTARSAADKVNAAYASTHERLQHDPEYVLLKAAAQAEECARPSIWLERNRFALYVETNTP